MLARILLKLSEESVVLITCAVIGLMAVAVEPIAQDYADARRQKRRDERKKAKGTK